MKRKFLDLVIMHAPALPDAKRLLSLIKEHPELGIVPEETHYFSTDAFSNGAQWYESHFDGCLDGQKRVEASTSYLASAGVAARLSREYPDAKLCAIIADPIECVYSAYRAATVEKSISVDLESWLEAEPRLLETYKFGRQLTSFFGYYSPVDLMVITMGDVRENVGKVVMSFYDHVGVNKSFVPKVLRVLTEDEVKPGFFARQLRLDKWRARRRASRLSAAQVQFPVPTVALTARERILLSRYFEHDVAILSALLNRDFRALWQYPVVNEVAKSKKHQ